MQNSPSLTTIENLFLHVVTIIIRKNRTRKLRDIRYIADGPMHSNPLHSDTNTLPNLQDTKAMKNNYGNYSIRSGKTLLRLLEL